MNDRSEAAIRSLAAAARLARGATGRKGNIVHLDHLEEVVVAGDLHGNLTNLKRLIERAALDRHPARGLILQELVHGSGRYPNQGDTSHRAVELACVLIQQFPGRVAYLSGNHELAEWLGQPVAKDGVPLPYLFRLGVEHAHGESAERMIETLGELFGSLPLAARAPNGLFVSHSLPTASARATFDVRVFNRFGIAKEDAEKKGSVRSLVWGRDVSADNVTAFLEMVEARFLITGHIPCDKGYASPSPRHLILDCVADPAAFALLPTRQPMSEIDFLRSIRDLAKGEPVADAMT